MRELWGAEKLEAELEAAKDGLRGLEKNIRKILGRDVPEGENGTAASPASARVAQKRPLVDDVRGRRGSGAEFQNNGFGPKRRWPQGGNSNNNAEPKTVFSRLSARVASAADDSDNEDDNAIKPAVSSRVIATPREIPSRQDVIRRESTDERSKQRNRRMFGALLGTLQKFRQEETKLKAKEDKKAEVEARVEEARRREKEELKRERQQLFLNRKQQLAQVKALEAKLARSKQFQEWRSSQIPLLNFIKTKTQPPIYYLPKRSTPKSDTLLQESSKELKEEIDKREKDLVEELEIIQAQAGSNRSLFNKSHENLDQSMDEPEEENRDPNPEKNSDMIDADGKPRKKSSADKGKKKDLDKQDDKVEDKEVDRYENTEDREEDEDEDREENEDEDREENEDEDREENEDEDREENEDEDREENGEESREESLLERMGEIIIKKEKIDESSEINLVYNRIEFSEDVINNYYKNVGKVENSSTGKNNDKNDGEDNSKDDSKNCSQENDDRSSQLGKEDSSISMKDGLSEKMDESSD